MLLQQEEMVHLLGTIISGGLIHIWCCSEYLWQQDGVCETESVWSTVCVWKEIRRLSPDFSLKLTVWRWPSLPEISTACHFNLLYRRVDEPTDHHFLLSVSGLTYWRLNETELYHPLPDSFDSGAYLLLQEASMSLVSNNTWTWILIRTDMCFCDGYHAVKILNLCNPSRE